jgi:hypothetical protein
VHLDPSHLALQILVARLSIHGKDDGVGWRSKVEPNDVPALGLKLGIGRNAPRASPLQADAQGFPRVGPFHMAWPPGGFVLIRFRISLAESLGILVNAGAAAAEIIAQAHQSLLLEPHPPFADCRRTRPDLGCDVDSAFAACHQ